MTDNNTMRTNSQNPSDPSRTNSIAPGGSELAAIEKVRMHKNCGTGIRGSYTGLLGQKLKMRASFNND